MAYGLGGAHLLSGIGEGIQQAGQTVLRQAVVKKRLDFYRERLERETAHKRRLLAAQIGWTRGRTGGISETVSAPFSNTPARDMAPAIAPPDRWEKEVGRFTVPAAKPIDVGMLTDMYGEEDK